MIVSGETMHDTGVISKGRMFEAQLTTMGSKFFWQTDLMAMVSYVCANHS